MYFPSKGSLLSGYLIGNKTELFGFKKTFIVSFSIYLFVFIYVLCMFRFCSKRFKLVSDQKEHEQEDTQTKKNSCQVLLKNEIAFFTDAFKILSKKREANARFHIISLLIVYFIGASVSLGLSSIQYLYLVKNGSVQMSQINYGYFKALNTLTRAVSLLVILPILKYYSVPDYWFYLIGITSELLNLIVFASASLFSSLIWIGKYYFK